MRGKVPRRCNQSVLVHYCDRMEARTPLPMDLHQFGRVSRHKPTNGSTLHQGSPVRDSVAATKSSKIVTRISYTVVRSSLQGTRHRWRPNSQAPAMTDSKFSFGLKVVPGAKLGAGRRHDLEGLPGIASPTAFGLL